MISVKAAPYSDGAHQFCGSFFEIICWTWKRLKIVGKVAHGPRKMFLTAYGFVFDSILSKNIFLLKNMENWLLQAKHYKLPYIKFDGLITKFKEFVLRLRVLKFQTKWAYFGNW